MVQHIQVGKQSRPFHFSYKALKRSCQDLGRKLADFTTGGLDFNEIEVLIYRGFQAGAEKEKIVVDFQQSDIEDWIDQDFSLIQQCTTEIENAFAEPTTDTKKKKTIPIKKK